jgi:hypothetical protein
MRLVVDASIASTVHPTGKCRHFLDGMLRICHRAVFTQETRRDWRNHAMPIATKWLRSMHAKKKIDKIAPGELLPHTGLRNKISGCAASRKDRDAMMKDVHLIELALAMDSIIVSRDDTARGLFSGASKTVGEIRKVIWINPVEEVDPCSWLEKGASAEDRRMLGKLGEST